MRLSGRVTLGSTKDFIKKQKALTLGHARTHLCDHNHVHVKASCLSGAPVLPCHATLAVWGCLPFSSPRSHRHRLTGTRTCTGRAGLEATLTSRCSRPSGSGLSQPPGNPFPPWGPSPLLVAPSTMGQTAPCRHNEQEIAGLSAEMCAKPPGGRLPEARPGLGLCLRSLTARARICILTHFWGNPVGCV